MINRAEIFLNYVETVFSKKASIYKGEASQDEFVTPSVLVFNDIPERGFMTCITYGLSLVDHPKWNKKRRPELILTVNTNNLQWAFSIVDLISQLRGKFQFSYGQRINFDNPIVLDSNMTGFLFFAPTVLNPEEYLDIDIKAPFKICLTGVYPISNSEMKIIDKNGLEKFWKNEQLDILNVNRE